MLYIVCDKCGKKILPEDRVQLRFNTVASKLMDVYQGYAAQTVCMDCVHGTQPEITGQLSVEPTVSGIQQPTVTPESFKTEPAVVPAVSEKQSKRKRVTITPQLQAQLTDALCNTDMSRAAIAKKYGVSISTVHRLASVLIKSGVCDKSYRKTGTEESTPVLSDEPEVGPEPDPEPVVDDEPDIAPEESVSEVVVDSEPAMEEVLSEPEVPVVRPRAEKPLSVFDESAVINRVLQEVEELGIVKGTAKWRSACVTKLHYEGVPNDVIVRKLGLSHMNVQRILDNLSASEARRLQKEMNVDVGKVLALHKAGWSPIAIAEDAKTTEDKVKYVIAHRDEIQRQVKSGSLKYEDSTPGGEE